MNPINQTADLAPALVAPRYAIYFAPPPGSDWWRAGSAWLGRCAATAQTCVQPEFTDLPQQTLARLTTDPARYGWHATLKAPFTLADGESLAELECRLAKLCAGLPAFTLPPLRVTRMGHFLALTPEATSDHLRLVADTLVTGLHSLAAPLPAAELDRRRAGGLSDRQEALLQAWGYPYVMDQFKFHFSLSGSLIHEPTAVADALATAAQSWFGALPPCRFGAVALFLEPARGEPMQWMGEWPLNGREASN